MFDEQLYSRRVSELVAEGMPRENAEMEASLEQPDGDTIAVDPDQE